MEITGHKTRSMFERYGIVDERDMRSAFEAVAGYANNLPKDRKVDLVQRRNTDAKADAEKN